MANQTDSDLKFNLVKVVWNHVEIIFSWITYWETIHQCTQDCVRTVHMYFAAIEL